MMIDELILNRKQLMVFLEKILIFVPLKTVFHQYNGDTEQKRNH